MMFAIEILAVGLLQSLHELGERLFRTLDPVTPTKVVSTDSQEICD
jgi:hypothetical protein